jgi:hypothetical protein
MTMRFLLNAFARLHELKALLAVLRITSFAKLFDFDAMAHLAFGKIIFPIFFCFKK